MTIVNVGVSHRFAPAEVLERLAVTSGELGGVLAHAVRGIDEVAVLSTCNRVEVYAAASGPAGQVTLAVADLMAARVRAQAGEILRLARVRVGGAAAGHLFSLACGLDSMAVCEDQIVAQIKDAARAARAAGTAGPALTGLIDAALRASKRARTQTAISTEGISLAQTGLDLAAGHLSGLAARDAVVLGTGSVGKLAARLLCQAGVGRLGVASRTVTSAPGRQRPGGLPPMSNFLSAAWGRRHTDRPDLADALGRTLPARVPQAERTVRLLADVPHPGDRRRDHPPAGAPVPASPAAAARSARSWPHLP